MAAVQLIADCCNVNIFYFKTKEGAHPSSTIQFFCTFRPYMQYTIRTIGILQTDTSFSALIYSPMLNALCKLGPLSLSLPIPAFPVKMIFAAGTTFVVMYERYINVSVGYGVPIDGDIVNVKTVSKIAGVENISEYQLVFTV